jgi:uroporphyrin-III C-methyltransferase
MGGHVGAPEHWRGIEERPGFPGVLRAWGGMGGHVGAPHVQMTGTVYLVGAGPGDPRLITVRGLELLRRADLVAYDRLVSQELVAEAPSWAEVVFVGKASGNHCMPQDQISALLVDGARRGLDVVRLKGGDPFVFGRGGEEALTLAAAGIPFEVVPGVSSALAVPAAAGIPLTHRGLASSFAVVTGHDEGARGSELPWEKLASGVDTLVLLMAVGNLRRLAATVVEHGRPASTPVAVIRCGTTPEQEVVLGTLATIADRAARLAPPAVVVIGSVVNLAGAMAAAPAVEEHAS